MDAEDIVDLLRKALAGDERAMTRLVARLTPVIKIRVARTLLIHRSYLGGGGHVGQEVEDLVQEILLLLFSNDERVLRSWRAEGGLSVPNFVGLVSKRFVLSWLHSRTRNPRHEHLEEGEWDLEVDPEPRQDDDVRIREELLLLLDRLRARLSPQGFFLFELLFVQQLSVPDVMAVTGLSDVAVYAWSSRLRRLALRLRAELSGNTPPERNPEEDGN